MRKKKACLVREQRRVATIEPAGTGCSIVTDVKA